MPNNLKLSHNHPKREVRFIQPVAVVGEQLQCIVLLQHAFGYSAYKPGVVGKKIGSNTNKTNQ
jgi:hypothetical protein